MTTMSDDLISRQAAIDVIEDYPHGNVWNVESMEEMADKIKALTYVQPEPSIPLSWIEKHIEWHKSLDNVFAELVAAHISAMVNKWRDEQNETD